MRRFFKQKKNIQPAASNSQQFSQQIGSSIYRLPPWIQDDYTNDIPGRKSWIVK